jgi:hypothetical protein
VIAPIPKANAKRGSKRVVNWIVKELDDVYSRRKINLTQNASFFPMRLADKAVQSLERKETILHVLKILWMNMSTLASMSNGSIQAIYNAFK